MQVWILTFNRPEALNRLVFHFGAQNQKVNIFSNYPSVQIREDNRKHIDKIIINSLNSEESNSWCARSWNTIMMKAFAKDEEAILIQDDTDISMEFMNWINEQKNKYDFIWGPAGDQFHYMRKSILQKVGWWDERYIGCYAGDAEYLKRVYMNYDKDKISAQDSHNWGFVHNPCGLQNHVITTYNSKTIDTNYENQHWEFERISGDGGKTTETNPTILHAQQLFRDKWGIDLDNGRPIIDSLNRKMPEIDWYPWATKKFEVTYYANNIT